MKSIFLVPVLLLASCVTNMTPALSNQASQAQITQDTFDSFVEVINNSTLEDEAKKEVISKLELERSKYEMLLDKQVVFLKSLGDVDWVALGNAGLDIWLKVKESN